MSKAHDQASAKTKTKSPKEKHQHAIQGGTSEANRQAIIILEVLAGVRLPSEAAQLLGVSVTHYYLLERKALEAMLAGCQPQAKGRSTPSAHKQLARLERELAQCRHQCQRQAALVRATQRAVGLPPAAAASTPSKDAASKKKAGTSSGKRRRRRRPTVRALRAAEALQKNSALSNSPQQVQPPGDANSALTPKSGVAGSAAQDRSGGT